MSDPESSEQLFHNDPRYDIVNVLLDVITGHDWWFDEWRERLQSEISPVHPHQIGALISFCAKSELPEELVLIIGSRIIERDRLPLTSAKLREYVTHYVGMHEEIKAGRERRAKELPPIQTK
jgi:hypothetical protein